MADDLTKKMCVSCEGKGLKPFSKSQAEDYLTQTKGWMLDSENKKISKEYKFKNFVESMAFVNHVAAIAESEGHHPDIHINYSKVLLELTTHAIDGLSINDFILVAKIDKNK